MRTALVTCLVLLTAAAVTPRAEAQEKKAKAPKKLYDINWGRRSDITLKFQPLRSHPYVRF
jgi:hypothetical protein